MCRYVVLIGFWILKLVQKIPRSRFPVICRRVHYREAMKDSGLILGHGLSVAGGVKTGVRPAALFPCEAAFSFH